MASFFNLILDTTPPSVEIYMPPYTIVGLETEIKIVADEALSNYQNFWLEDAEGSILYLILEKTKNNEFTLVYSFAKPGIYKLYYQVEDEVANRSILNNIELEVYEAVAMNILTEEKTMEIVKRIFNTDILTKNKTNLILYAINERKPALLNVRASKIEKRVIKIE